MRTLVTLPTLERGFREIGLREGSVVLVHCALSSLGQVHGGAHTFYKRCRTC